jgi:hypothetical protein
MICRTTFHIWSVLSFETESYLVGTGGSFPKGNATRGGEADHSPPSSAEVKNDGAVPPLPRMSLWHSA